MLKDKLEEMLFVQLAGWFEQYEIVLPFGQGAFVDVKFAQDLHEIWNDISRPGFRFIMNYVRIHNA